MIFVKFSRDGTRGNVKGKEYRPRVTPYHLSNNGSVQVGSYPPHSQPQRLEDWGWEFSNSYVTYTSFDTENTMTDQTIVVGFGGLGSMGAPMALNLQKGLAETGGPALRVWNRTASKTAEAVAAGAVAVDSLGQLGAECGVVFLMTFDDDALKTAFKEIEAQTKSKASKTIIVSCATVDPQLVALLANSADKNGKITLISCPVFGRPDAAAARQLVGALAGEKWACDLAEPYIKHMTRKITRLPGESAHTANVLKLTGNFGILSIIEILAQAQTLGEKNGVPRHVVAELLSTLMPGPIVGGYAQRIASDDFAAGFSVLGGLKDAGLMLGVAKDSGVKLPFAEIAHEHLTRQAADNEDLDWGSLAQIYQLHGEKEGALDVAAKNSFVARRRRLLLSNEDLDTLWDLLWQRASREVGPDARRLSFADLKGVHAQLLLIEKAGADKSAAASSGRARDQHEVDRFAAFFRPSVFARFLCDADGLVGVHEFFNYVLRKVSLMQARLDLAIYDKDNDGFLTPDDLARFLSDLVPSLSLSLAPSVIPFYLATAQAKFSFFLDQNKRRRFAIHAILLSPILTELFELREPNLPDQLVKTNWFSDFYVLKIYGQFLALDQDQNGLLSRDEISRFNSGTLTDIYLDRLYEERQTRQNQIDYNTFVELILVLENPSSAQSITYQFKLLDINHKTYLDYFTITALFKQVVAKMVSFGHEPVIIDDVVVSFPMPKQSENPFEKLKGSISSEQNEKNSKGRTV
ncbi:Serine/threonine-protein phosphatase 2A regulatory subunit B'' subunit gamma [Physocladia obscura]|uniref:Serine/threonine-protein phosphatase 2A regulatory subunit B'' subunit gamma n=1 Tax=Physocladia obscura TaxID=109957 RepID=A0AAD5T5Q3_9FUNG|nr:Serine/threonine-protein phosphatase 2A regulatory subunit B'' subunit gamma [Physocladia obscura]